MEAIAAVVQCSSATHKLFLLEDPCEAKGRKSLLLPSVTHDAIRTYKEQQMEGLNHVELF